MFVRVRMRPQLGKRSVAPGTMRLVPSAVYSEGTAFGIAVERQVAPLGADVARLADEAERQLALDVDVPLLQERLLEVVLDELRALLHRGGIDAAREHLDVPGPKTAGCRMSTPAK